MSYGQSYNSYPAYGEAQSNPYGGNQGYGATPAYGQNPYNQDVEMNPVPHPMDPNTLLNEVQKIKESIGTLRTLRENRLAVAQNALLESNSPREEETARQALGEIQRDIDNAYRKLKDDVARIKSTPGSGNVQVQLEVQGRAIHNEFEEYQKSQMTFTRRLKEQIRRRVRLNMDGATDEEVDQQVDAISAGHGQVFQVAGARSKQANDVKSAVQARSIAFREIEAGVVEIANLVSEMAEWVERQEPAVAQIDQGAERVAEDLGNANTQLDSAIVSARKARKWKWYALLTIILIIAIVVGVAVGVTQANKA